MKKLILIPITLALILVALIQSPQATTSNQNYKEHYFGNIQIQLPQSAKIIDNKIKDSELLSFSIYFDDKELLLRGYIQLWQLTDVEKFLALSKEHSTYDFSLFTLTPITINNFDGLMNEWSAYTGDPYISGKDYWLKRNDSNQVLRIAFLTNTFTFSEKQLVPMDKILNSLRWE